MTNAFLRRLGFTLPIIQAPMGGGPSTPELVAAVSNAGGFGTLAAAYLTPLQIIEGAARIRALTDKPFGINLFAGGYEETHAVDPRPMTAVLAEIHDFLGLPPPVLPPVPSDPFADQFLAVLETRPNLFSFTFGIPSANALAACRANGMLTAGTATTAEEARTLADAGVDAIVAQGAEAGAHRGTFAGRFEDAMIPTLSLVREVAGATTLPVIASGGLMDGRDLGRAIDAGAAAVQLGTAFLVCPESGAPAAHKQAVLDARDDRTVVTRAFSGRPARGIANVFIYKFAGRQDIILPYPLQNAFTRAMRAAAAQNGNADYLSLWAGTGAPRARALPAGELVRRLSSELERALTSRRA